MSTLFMKIMMFFTNLNLKKINYAEVGEEVQRKPRVSPMEKENLNHFEFNKVKELKPLPTKYLSLIHI